jgi:hypothetical protein
MSVVFLLLPVLFMLAAAGCGGDAGRAKGYIQKGDAELVKMKTVSDRLTKSTDVLFAAVFAGGKVDASSFQKNAATVTTAASQFAAAALLAKKQYASIDSLKNVAGYKKYADLQVKALGLNEQGIAQLKAFVEKWTQAISAPGFDPVAFVGAAKELSAQSTSIADQIENLEKEAAQVKKSQNL